MSRKKICKFGTKEKVAQSLKDDRDGDWIDEATDVLVETKRHFDYEEDRGHLWALLEDEGPAAVFRWFVKLGEKKCKRQKNNVT